MRQAGDQLIAELILGLPRIGQIATRHFRAFAVNSASFRVTYRKDILWTQLCHPLFRNQSSRN